MCVCVCVYIYIYIILLNFSEVEIAQSVQWLDYRLDDRATWVRFLAQARDFSCLQTDPVLHSLLFKLYLGLEWPGFEDKHARPSTVEVKNVWSPTSTPLQPFMVYCLTKHWDNLALSQLRKS